MFLASRRRTHRLHGGLDDPAELDRPRVRRSLPVTMRDTSSRSSMSCDCDFALRSMVSSARPAVPSGRLPPRSSRAQPRMAVERRPQLVRERGEEIVLRAVGGLGLGVEPRVLVSHGGLRRQGRREPLVGLAELIGVELVGQVEPAGAGPTARGRPPRNDVVGDPRRVRPAGRSPSVRQSRTGCRPASSGPRSSFPVSRTPSAPRSGR